MKILLLIGLVTLAVAVYLILKMNGQFKLSYNNHTSHVDLGDVVKENLNSHPNNKRTIYYTRGAYESDAPEPIEPEEPGSEESLGSGKNFSSPYSMNKTRFVKGSTSIPHFSDQWAEDYENKNHIFGHHTLASGHRKKSAPQKS